LALKNWLIRTKNKQILGPATKDKVIELVEKGSLTGEDEITCGNGYWFWVREKTLLEKYLYGDLTQTFNPISEARDVLTAKSSPDGVTASIVESQQRAKSPPAPTPPPADGDILPDDDDLAYPDMGDLDYPSADATPAPVAAKESSPPTPVAVNIPAVDETGEVTLSDLDSGIPEENYESEEDINFLYPDAADLEYPELPGRGPAVTKELEGMKQDSEDIEEQAPEIEEDATDPNVAIPQLSEEVQPPEPLKKSTKKKSKKKKRVKREVVKERRGNDRYLIFIALLLVTVIGVVIYYYKSVLNKPLPVIGIASAEAQTIESLSKKKIF